MMTDATNNPEQPSQGGIFRIKTNTDESGKKYRTMDIEELDKRAQMAEAATKSQVLEGLSGKTSASVAPEGKPEESASKKAADIILDIDEILDRHEQKSGKNAKTGNALVDFGNTVNQLAIGLSPIGIKDRTAFFQLLSVMINAGIPLVKSLAILSEQMTNQRLSGIIANMMKLVDKGYSLSESMNEYQKIFTEAQIGMVESAEASGQMNEILHQIAVEMEKSARINARVKGAMRYPMVIVGMLLLIGGLMMVMVVPKFVEIFTSSGVTLPMPTKILIFISGLFVNYWIFGVIGLFGLYIAFQIWRKSTLGRYYFDLFVISLPIVGELARKISLSRFTRGLANELFNRA
jgi:type IV pilus assembly protein PilC